MNRHKTVLLVLFLLLVSAIAGILAFDSGRNAVSKKDTPGNNGFAVVELFTSEGCSSCPAADKTVARLLAKKLDKVYILSFHVDYWNRLGWDDPFSQSLFTARQRKYATFFSLNSVYTPQVVVNGRSEFTGSNESRLYASIKKEVGNDAQSDLQIVTKRTGDAVSVSYTTSIQKGLLHLALVQPEATTIVKKGENRGSTLHHVNIVRALHTVDLHEKGYLTIGIPKDLAGIPLQLIAYTQSKENFIILGADQKTL